MDYDDFIGAVQHRAQLGDRQSAITATRATLETLGERLLEEQSTNLASELPQEVGEYLRHVSGPERFDAQEFLTRVARKENKDANEATYHARVVTEVLREAVSPGAFEKLERSLPGDYGPLIRSGSSGPMAAS